MNGHAGNLSGNSAADKSESVSQDQDSHNMFKSEEGEAALSVEPHSPATSGDRTLQIIAQLKKNDYSLRGKINPQLGSRRDFLLEYLGT